MATYPYRGLMLHREYVWKVIEQFPQYGPDAPGQSRIWGNYFTWKDFGVRNILMRRITEQSQLAGLYGPGGGTAFPRPKPGGEQFAATLMDVKSYDYVDPDVVRDDMELGELAILNSLESMTGSRLKAKVNRYISDAVQGNMLVVNNQLEYLAIGALNDAIVWPPLDADGNSIDVAQRPRYWNSDVAGTWSVGLPANLNIDLATLTDADGNAATANQKKYWTDATADMIGALDVIDETCRRLHNFTIYGGTMLSRSVNLKYLAANTALLNLVRGDNNELPGARDFIHPMSLRENAMRWLRFGWSDYDSFWTWELPSKTADYTPQQVYYLDDDYIIIIPPGGVGGWMGTAPLMDQAGNWNPGFMPWIWQDDRPNYRMDMGVHVTAWPIFERPRWVRIKIKA